MLSGDEETKPKSPAKLRQHANDEPLAQRLPKFDENGRRLSDFMVLIPGLNKRSGTGFESRIKTLHQLLDDAREVVFADLNLPLNLLWVSVSPGNRVMIDLSDRIRQQIPEARLVGHMVLGDDKSTTDDRFKIGSTEKPRVGH